MAMKYSHHVNKVAAEDVANNVWETSDKCQTHRSMNDRMDFRHLANTIEDLIHAFEKLTTES